MHDLAVLDAVLLPLTLKVTVLSNGVRVATEDGAGELASLSIAVDTGSRFETKATNGTSAVLSQLGFQGQADKVHPIFVL